MPEPRYLTALDVQSLHDFIMEKTGDVPSSLRERSLLESAVMRPRMAGHYADADLVGQAAILAIGISQAQAFVDGNKRTAFIAADVFLRANGYLFAGDPLELAQRLEAIATRDGSVAEATARFTDWLGKRVIRRVLPGLGPRQLRARYAIEVPVDEPADRVARQRAATEDSPRE